MMGRWRMYGGEERGAGAVEENGWSGDSESGEFGESSGMEASARRGGVFSLSGVMVEVEEDELVGDDGAVSFGQ